MDDQERSKEYVHVYLRSWDLGICIRVFVHMYMGVHTSFAKGSLVFCLVFTCQQLHHIFRPYV